MMCLRFWDYITLILFLAIFPLLVPAIYMTQQIIQRQTIRTHLQHNPKITEGTIIARSTIPAEGDPNVYYVTYQYEVEAGDGNHYALTRDQDVDAAAYQQLTIGTRVPIMYAATDPTLSTIQGIPDFITGMRIVAGLAYGLIVLFLIGFASGVRNFRKRYKLFQQQHAASVPIAPGE